MAQQQLNQSNSCCSTINTFQYAELAATSDKLIAIDSNSPVFQFEEGKSFFSAFRLPLNSGDLQIKIEGLMGKTVFNPSVLMLDSQFNVTRKLAANIFTYQPAYLLDGDRMEANFIVDRSYVGNPKNETYMVIYSNYTTLSDSTQAISASKQMTKSLNVQDYGMKDPLIPHSAWGLLKVSSDDIDVAKEGENYYKPVYQAPINSSLNKTEAMAMTAPTVKPIPAMLTKDEFFYQSQIEQAVLSGDINKAMSLVSEAEKAGSTTAKTTFIEVIKSSQKNNLK